MIFRTKTRKRIDALEARVKELSDALDLLEADMPPDHSPDIEQLGNDLDSLSSRVDDIELED